jgi:hypothetical protein
VAVEAQGMVVVVVVVVKARELDGVRGSVSVVWHGLRSY